MYVYEPTEEELLAVAILTKNGWTVESPKCPLCHGWGTVGETKESGSGRMLQYVYSLKQCPNGCPLPLVYL